MLFGCTLMSGQHSMEGGGVGGTKSKHKDTI